MTHRAPGLIRLPQWAVVNKTIVSQDHQYDTNGVVTITPPTDFSGGGVIYFTAQDQFGNIVMQKTSEVPSEIEITIPLTAGLGILKFVEADTAPLSTNRKLFQYYFDIWGKTSDGREEPIVDRGQLFIDKSVTRISLGPTPSLPSFPAAQNQQQRSFVWEATVEGDVFTIPVPGSGMVPGYAIMPSIAEIPIGGFWTSMYCPESLSTPTEFQLYCASPIPIGTRVYFLLRGV